MLDIAVCEDLEIHRCLIKEKISEVIDEPYEIVATTYQAISGAGKTFQDWPEMV